MTVQFIEAVRDPETGLISLVENTQRKLDYQWTSLRTQRNQLLAASDWTRLDDVSLTDEQKAQWAEYRAALRDVTKGLEDPARVQWPTRPSP